MCQVNVESELRYGFSLDSLGISELVLAPWQHRTYVARVRCLFAILEEKDFHCHLNDAPEKAGKLIVPRIVYGGYRKGL